ncbi:phosphotransferase family protein [Desulfovibrio ferrophilus]|uniref:Aminoglycoside phosphotransferase n=1 Tax=Desulfovibrio ferrophilus TaxID=241368 RepID=A0A2Z6AYK4_9BACT|nr:phosphotransferase [Desulfovibrio ferrophilus]BBD08344.1 aminoglycoside phosphotransferase [Desulfovibrio ferrophilus]
MIEMKREHIERYLQEALGGDVTFTGAGDIGSLDEQGIKDFGYGKPLLVRWEKDGVSGEGVISAMRGDKYGHQDYWDRARILLFQYETSARLSKHVRPLGAGYVNAEGRMIPLHEVREFFIVNEKLEGSDYFLELERIRKGELLGQDLELTRGFARWLAEIHGVKHDEVDRYDRRIRNLIGDCECIYGIIDGYPHPYSMFPPERFLALEKRLVDWRWKLKGYTHRLAEVHGDFHPWNVLVRRDEGAAFDFSVLDRSRGVWGEPADDVATMSMNYVLYGLLDGNTQLEGPFLDLYMAFWESYLEATGDREMLEVIAPFYVFRGLVVASPEWYPRLAPQVRTALLSLVEKVLEDERFDYADINRYLR